MKKKIYAVVITLFSVAAVVSAKASRHDVENDARGLLSAKMSLTQAITMAEKHFAGKASHAEFEKNDGKLMYDIEIVSTDTVVDVQIDADSGQLIASSVDAVDRGDDDIK
jgi:uncharacterized membrane protein YkoI